MATCDTACGFVAWLDKLISIAIVTSHQGARAKLPDHIFRPSTRLQKRGRRVNAMRHVRSHVAETCIEIWS